MAPKRGKQTTRPPGADLGQERGPNHERGPMVSMTVYLYQDQAESLKKCRERMLIPASVLVRHGVDMALQWAADRQEKFNQVDD